MLDLWSICHVSYYLETDWLSPFPIKSLRLCVPFLLKHPCLNSLPGQPTEMITVNLLHKPPSHSKNWILNLPLSVLLLSVTFPTMTEVILSLSVPNPFLSTFTLNNPRRKPFWHRWSCLSECHCYLPRSVLVLLATHTSELEPQSHHLTCHDIGQKAVHPCSVHKLIVYLQHPSQYK